MFKRKSFTKSTCQTAIFISTQGGGELMPELGY